MKHVESWKGMIAVLLTLCFLPACPGLEKYGSVRVADGEWANSIQNLVENWQEYHIYYAGLSYKSPSAIMFVPKQSNKRVVSGKWMPVTDRSVAAAIVTWLNSYMNFPPTLWKILGPNGDFFGYVYTSAEEQVVVREMEPNILFVEDIPLPPFDYGPGGKGEG
ncbi:MAG: hypothetical protein J7M32_02485 [Deltaproteobacteria bacterium]|nr:hypothetical protein [Deltaproteobacteria bacterium]